MRQHDSQRKWWASTCALVLALGAGTASAQEVEERVVVTEETRTGEVAVEPVVTTPAVEQRTVVRTETVEPAPQPAQRMRFIIEGSGSYGVQFGETDYLPAGAPGDWQHPIVTGYGVGATVGLELHPAIALVANYEYSNAWSRHGSIAGVLDDVQGEIDYHTVVGGVRLALPIGPGAIQAELAGGVMMPFQTEITYLYGPALTQLPTPITGTGSRIDNYSIGFGGHGLIGYRFDLGDVLYLATNIKLRLFESENSGETTVLRNFVTDFTAVPPTATTAEIVHGDGAAQPSTNSVQDVRFQLAIGARI